jgi:hypothetical protein
VRNTDRQIERKCAVWVERESKIGTASVCTCVCVCGWVCVGEKQYMRVCMCVCVCAWNALREKGCIALQQKQGLHNTKYEVYMCVPYSSCKCSTQKERQKESWLISSDSASCTCCACKEWGYGRKCGVERPSSFFHPLQYYLWSTTHCERDENGSQNDWEIPWC